MKPIASTIRERVTLRTRVHVAVWLLLSLAGASATAADDSLDLLEQENHVFAASRYVQTIEQTPANVSLLSREDIQRFGYRNINEALSAMTGIYNSSSQWPALGVRGLAVPGDFGSRLLFLVNGMPIYEATYGGFFIEYLDIESIDRIELVKGTGSALYGSGAVLGIINLITRPVGDGSGKTLAAEADSKGAGKLYGSWGRKGSGGDASFVSVSSYRDRGHSVYLSEFDNAEFDQARYHGVVDGAHNTASTLRLFSRATLQDAWFQGLLIAGKRRDPLASYGTVFNDDLKLKETLAALEIGISRDVGNGTVLTARGFGFSVAEQGDYPYAFDGGRVPGDAYVNVSDLSTHQIGAELRYDRFLSNGHHILLGAEAKRVSGHQQIGDQPNKERAGIVTVDAHQRFAQWAVFGQDEFGLWGGKFFLGARWDAYRGFSEGVKSRLSPRIAYVYDFSAKTTGKLIYGQAYRAPTIYEALYQDGLPAAQTLWANSTLGPELARALEAIVEHQAQRGLKFRLSAFLNRLNNTPLQVRTPEYNGVPCALGLDSCNQYRNSAETQQVAGLESDVKIRYSDNASLYASLIWQHGKLGDMALASSPAVTAKFGFSHPLPWLAADAALEAQHIGAAQGLLNQDGSRGAKLPAYLLINATFNSAMIPGCRVSLRLNNLLDKKIYTLASRELGPLQLVPAAGRSVSLHVQRDF